MPNQPDQPTPHRRTRADDRIAELDTRPTTLLAQIEALTAERDAALATADALTAERDAALATADDNLMTAQRAAADYANLKRRSEADRERDLDRAREALLTRVVELADDFDLALEHLPPEARDNPWLEGIVAIDRKLRALLEREGWKPEVVAGTATAGIPHAAWLADQIGRAHV
jgi:molecular chaperone GrpE